MFIKIVVLCPFKVNADYVGESEFVLICSVRVVLIRRWDLLLLLLLALVLVLGRLGFSHLRLHQKDAKLGP